MKTLLTITVLVSSLLSIFSSSLKLYEVPVFREVVSVIKQDNGARDISSETKRVYISHDVSGNTLENNTPLVVAKKNKTTQQTDEKYINVFGVKVPNKNS